MKKHITLLIVVTVLCCLAGCRTTPANETTGTQAILPTETTSTIVKPEASQLPMVAVSLPIITQTEIASDGTELFRYTYQNISLVVPDPEVADKAILHFLNKTDMQENAEQILAAAKSVYAENSHNWTPYVSQVLYTPTRVDQSVMSLSGSHTTYTGTPHPETVYSSLNYNMLTGEFLTLPEILVAEDSGDKLSQFIIDILSKQKESLYIRDGFEDTVKARFAKSLSDDFDWYFSFEGLIFYFVPYDIAPYASGVIKAEIPYTQLTGILKDDYFPRESDSVVGTMNAAILGNRLDQYTQVAEIVVNKGANKILLYTDQMVQQLRIVTGSWSADGATFTQENTVFATDNLTPGDAIMLEAELTDSLPTIMLHYQSNGKITKAYVSLNDNVVKFTEQ